MDRLGAQFCPPGTVFVQSANGSVGKCCTGTANADRTDCLGGGGSCTVSTTDNVSGWMTDMNSCQFQKAKAEVGNCPYGYSSFTTERPNPNATDSAPLIYIVGCTDNVQNCYAASTIQRLQEIGYDVTGMIEC